MEPDPPSPSLISTTESFNLSPTHNPEHPLSLHSIIELLSTQHQTSGELTPIINLNKQFLSASTPSLQKEEQIIITVLTICTRYHYSITPLLRYMINKYKHHERLEGYEGYEGIQSREFWERIFKSVVSMCNKDNFALVLSLCVVVKREIGLGLDSFEQLFQCGILMLSNIDKQQSSTVNATADIIAELLSEPTLSPKPSTLTEFQLDPSSISPQPITPTPTYSSSLTCLALTYFSQFSLDKYEPLLTNILESTSIIDFFYEQQCELFENTLLKSLISIYVNCHSNDLVKNSFQILRKIICFKLTPNILRTIVKSFKIDTKDQLSEHRFLRIFELMNEGSKLYSKPRLLAEFPHSNSHIKRKISSSSTPCIYELKIQLKHQIGDSTLFIFHTKETHRIVLHIDPNTKHRELHHITPHQTTHLRKFETTVPIYCCCLEFKKNHLELFCIEQETIFTEFKLELTCDKFTIGEEQPNRKSAINKLLTFNLHNSTKPTFIQQSETTLLTEHNIKHFPNIILKWELTFEQELQNIGGIEMFIIVIAYLIHELNNEDLLMKIIKEFYVVVGRMENIKEIVVECVGLAWLVINCKEKCLSPFLVFNILELIPTKNELIYDQMRLDFLGNFMLWKQQNYHFKKIIIRAIESMLTKLPRETQKKYIKLLLFDTLTLESYPEEHLSNLSTQSAHSNQVDDYLPVLALEILRYYCKELLISDKIEETVELVIYLYELFGLLLKNNQSKSSECKTKHMKSVGEMSTPIGPESFINNSNEYNCQLLITSILQISKTIKSSNLLNYKPSELYHQLLAHSRNTALKTSPEFPSFSYNLYHIYFNLLQSIREDYLLLLLNDIKTTENEEYIRSLWQFELQNNHSNLETSKDKTKTNKIDLLSTHLPKVELESKIIMIIFRSYLVNNCLSSLQFHIFFQLRKLSAEDIENIVNELKDNSLKGKLVNAKLAAYLQQKQNINRKDLSRYLDENYPLYKHIYWLLYCRNTIIKNRENISCQQIVSTILSTSTTNTNTNTITSENILSSTSNISEQEDNIRPQETLETLLEFIRNLHQHTSKETNEANEIMNILSLSLEIQERYYKLKLEGTSVLPTLEDILPETYLVELEAFLQKKLHQELHEYLPTDSNTKTTEPLSNIEQCKQWHKIIDMYTNEPYLNNQTLLETIKTRRESLIQLTDILSSLETKHYHFWSHFITEDHFYYLSNFVNNLKYHCIVFKQKNTTEAILPHHRPPHKETFNGLIKQTLAYEKYLHSLLQSFVLNNVEKSKKSKDDMFYITSTKIYQGKLTKNSYGLVFKENDVIDDEMYKQILASETEQRTSEEAKTDNKTFSLRLTEKSKITLKNYLQSSTAIEILSDNRSYFFCFLSESKQQFIKDTYLKYFTNHSNEPIYHKQCQWRNGKISNFEYLMHVNDFASRSFNDLSQYYIFPWTVTNFTSKSIDEQFLNTETNFRNLALQICECHPEKYKSCKIRSQIARENNDEDAFQFGRFYSNPAIVYNYLIRIEPFSTHHFSLQSNHFDEADRLFHSIESSWEGTERELIPEFYCFAEFLRNRSKYTFGVKRNNETVEDVILPLWVRTNTAEEFVFKMRKCLEGKTVTENLHKWIDNTFGINNQRKRNRSRIDKEKDKGCNMYSKYIYRQSREEKEKDKEKDKEMSKEMEKEKTSIVENEDFYKLYSKEFGQMPETVFKKNHPPCNIVNYSRRKKSKEFENIAYENRLEFSIEVCEYLNLANKSQLKLDLPKSFPFINSHKILSNTNFTLFSSANRIWIYCEQSGNIQRQNQIQSHVMSFDEKLTGLTLAEFEINEEIEETFLFTIENTKVYYYQQFKNAVFFSDYKFKNRILLMKEDDFTLLSSCNNCVLFTHDNTLFVLLNFFMKNYSLSHKLSQETFIKYSKYQIYEFKQHLAAIVALAVCEEQCLAITIDSSHCVFVHHIVDPLQIVSTFCLEELFMTENVKQFVVHPLNVMLILSENNRILLYNYFGEIIVNCIVSFDDESKSELEKELVTCLTFWSPESSDIILGTNMGNIWKLDIFDDLCPVKERKRSEEQESKHEVYYAKISATKDLKSKKYNLHSKTSVIELKMNRIGRHYQLFVLLENGEIIELTSESFYSADNKILNRIV